MASIANTDGHGWGLIIMLTHKVKLPGDYIVEFTWTGKHISEEFFKCSSRSDFLMAYYDERRKFTQLIANETGESILFAELDGPVEVIAPVSKNKQRG
jgi:hypothetical protein